MVSHSKTFFSEFAVMQFRYQKKMIGLLNKAYLDVADMKCAVEFHVCHLGEAHPLFLRALRDAVDGYFHPVTDVANIAREMAAQAIGSQSRISILGRDKNECSLPAGYSDGALCCRGVIPSSLFDDISHGHAAIRTRTHEECKMTNQQSIPMDPKLQEAIVNVLQLERQLGAIITELSREGTTPSLLASKGSQLFQLRKVVLDSFNSSYLFQLKTDSITVLSRSVRSGTILQAFLEKVLESVESQMESLTRLLEQYQAKEGEKFDATSVKKNDLFKHASFLFVF